MNKKFVGIPFKMKKLLGIIVLGLLLSNSANAKSIELKNCKPTWNAKNLYHTVGVKVDLDSFKIKTFNSDPDYLFIDGTYNIDASRTSSDDQLRNEKGLIYSKQYSAYNLLGGDQKKLMTGYKQASADYEIDLLDKTVTVIFKWDPNKLTRKEKKDLKKWGVNVKKVSTYKYACNSYFAKGFKKKEPKEKKPKQLPEDNKVASASGGTTQEVIVTHRNDYDIWDALLDFSAAIDPKNKTTTSSSSSNRGTNCVIGRTNSTFGTTTMNCN